MSLKTKTIEINPALFNISGSKAKKTQRKKDKPVNIPLISPNVLKNKLLKRIKDHKKRDTENLDNKKSPESPKNNTSNSSNSTNIEKYTNEFNDSIEYLQTLSNQKKVNNEKVAFEKKKEEIQRKTIKHHSSAPSYMPMVNLDLPDDLKEPLVNIVTEKFKPTNQEVPYGILKGGNKPTYRQWNKTQRNMDLASPNSSITINDNSINKSKTERENRLQLLKQKIHQKQQSVQQPLQPSVQPSVQQPIPNVPERQIIQIQTPIITENRNTPNIEDLMITQNLIQKPQQMAINEIQQTAGNLEENKPIKKITKKTIHRKYTLGKSKHKHSVAVLIKDRHTRKKVLTAQKELKKKPINDIKTYLRDHNLIKIGSNAPSDVLRKIYESSMLSGEVTNNNKDMLLHNFIKDADN